MTTKTFDTLNYTNRMMKVGFTREQAEGQAELMAETINIQLATKHDIALVLKDIMWIKVIGAAFGSAILGSLGILLSR